jgi:hypothetical protein
MTFELLFVCCVFSTAYSRLHAAYYMLHASPNIAQGDNFEHSTAQDGAARRSTAQHGAVQPLGSSRKQTSLFL